MVFFCVSSGSAEFSSVSLDLLVSSSFNSLLKRCATIDNYDKEKELFGTETVCQIYLFTNDIVSNDGCSYPSVENVYLSRFNNTYSASGLCNIFTREVQIYTECTCRSLINSYKMDAEHLLTYYHEYNEPVKTIKFNSLSPNAQLLVDSLIKRSPEEGIVDYLVSDFKGLLNIFTSLIGDIETNVEIQ